MASAVHISFEELPAAARELLERAEENGEIFIDHKGAGFKISRLPGRTANDALAMLRHSPDANVEVDENWAADMQEVIALRHSQPDRNPWE